MSKHTPGPWTKADRLNGPWWHISSNHTVGGQICKSGRQAIACVHGESKRGSKAYAEMFEANARLIAAAPDLLDALSSIDIYLSDTLSGRVKPDPATYKQWLIDGIAEARNRARVAIAKATGESA